MTSLGNEVTQLVDEAWAIRGASAVGDPGKFVVPMGRVVGTAGERSITIIVCSGTSQIVTAFPS
jgi:filamentous hemagglutinin